MNALSPRGEAARLRLVLIGIGARMRILRCLASIRKHAQTSVVAVEAKPVAGTLPTHSRSTPYHVPPHIQEPAAA